MPIDAHFCAHKVSCRKSQIAKNVPPNYRQRHYIWGMAVSRLPQREVCDMNDNIEHKTAEELSAWLCEGVDDLWEAVISEIGSTIEAIEEKEMNLAGLELVQVKLQTDMPMEVDFDHVRAMVASSCNWEWIEEEEIDRLQAIQEAIKKIAAEKVGA